MRPLQRLNIPKTFDPDDLRMRRILNIILLALLVISLVSLASTFVYGDSILDVLNDSEAKIIIFGSSAMTAMCLILIFLNRSTGIPKNIAGSILVIVMTAVVAFSDHPHELANGRSLIFWLLPVMLSVIVLPPNSVFLVDLIVFVIIALYSESLEQINIFAIFIIGGISILVWLGMSIANRAIRDARNEAEKNRAILNGVADGVMVLDDEDHVVLANPSALNMMGSAMSLLAEVDGERREIGGRVLSFNWSDVPGVGNVAIVRDVSRQVEVERAKDAILGVVSHEMRTPLASIIGFSEILKLSPASAEAADRIKVNAERMMKLVNDLLDHAQIQAGALRMTREEFSPAALARNIQDQFLLNVAEKNIRLDVNVSPDLPARLIGDSHRLQQVIVNLVGNAIKFTENGGEVDVSFLPGEDQSWQIVVTDTGIGIPPERLPDIFEPFRRSSDYDTRKHQGTGLGLSIAKKIVQLSGGDIAVNSEVGEGSTFSVTLSMETPE
jgi:signal transduction histidine kinase